ncbi:MAG: nitroreductase family protein [Deltaproteobacteria bacterium]|nr:nitroreductase family protein [Deltaproteobacteria bacterium]
MFLSLIRKRRSIRRYTQEPVEAEKLDLLVEAALRSPSSMGNTPWEFVIVTDPEVLERLSAAKPHGAAFLKNAPLAIIVCADPEKSTVWIEDASIAAIFIHLAAESLGLGSCWIQIRDRMHNENKPAGAYISEILDIPGHLQVEAMIAIGYPAEKAVPHPGEALLYERVFSGAYGRPYRK